jgi:hypothetical protein
MLSLVYSLTSSHVSIFIFTTDFYEEMLSLVYSLTSSHVSVHLWQVFQMMYTMFQKDGIDYFTGIVLKLKVKTTFS